MSAGLHDAAIRRMTDAEIDQNYKVVFQVQPVENLDHYFSDQSYYVPAIVKSVKVKVNVSVRNPF